ncbi:hypothetical protein [Peribacillus deserti]|nr:hypothetical protein [Peribacillus deserti]
MMWEIVQPSIKNGHVHNVQVPYSPEAVGNRTDFWTVLGMIKNCPGMYLL